MEIALLSCYIDQLRHGHIDQVFHNFSSIKSYAKIELVLDPFKNDFDGKFTAYVWEDFYSEVKEDFPENAPEARGYLVTMTQSVDTHHAGAMMNHRSHTGIIIYLYRATIIWYSKEKAAVKSSTFLSGMRDMWTGMELTKGLHYKLSILDVLVDEPTLVFCDNKLVGTNMSVPTSTLAKKYLSICYHALREAVAAGIHQIMHIAGEFNTADVLTKLLAAAVRMPHIGRIFN